MHRNPLTEVAQAPIIWPAQLDCEANVETSMQFPNNIDIRKAFDQRMCFQGRLNERRLLRLRELVTSPGKLEVDANLSFFRDDNNFRRIKGSVTGVMSVSCQRCLGPLDLRIQDDIELVLLESECDLTNLEPDLEPWIIEGAYLDPSEVVEEQLLLSMPIVSFHAEEECSNEPIDDIMRQDQNRADGENPFDVLKTLL
ncbi:MAG: hypothetical protein CL926_07145 [Deltaproteobacteria bacterium]|nr:hypothetical protein [Deltaproteobacteria bacterium]